MATVSAFLTVGLSMVSGPIPFRQPQVAGAEQYLCDPHGARTGLPQAVSSATYDAANELTQWGTTNLAYDLDGNLTSDGANTYTWDARNQLASVNVGTPVIFQYDAFGRRIQSAVGNQLLYDGANAVQEISSGSVVSTRLTGGVDEFFSRADSRGTFAGAVQGAMGVKEQWFVARTPGARAAGRGPARERGCKPCRLGADSR